MAEKLKKSKKVREDSGEGPSRSPVRSPTPKRKRSKSARDENPDKGPSRGSMFRTPLLNRSAPTPPTGTEPEPTFENYHVLNRRQRERVLYDEVIRLRAEVDHLNGILSTQVAATTKLGEDQVTIHKDHKALRQDIASVRLGVHTLTEQQTKVSERMSIFAEPPRPLNERRVYPSITFRQHVELVKAKHDLGQLTEMLPETVLVDVYEEFFRSAQPSDGPRMIRACLLTFQRYKPFTMSRLLTYQRNAIYTMMAHFDFAVGFQVPIRDWDLLDKRIRKQCNVLNGMERIPLPLFQTPLTEMPALKPEPEFDTIDQVLSEQAGLSEIGLIIKRLESESNEQLEPAEAVDHPEPSTSTRRVEPSASPESTTEHWLEPSASST